MINPFYLPIKRIKKRGQVFGLSFFVYTHELDNPGIKKLQKYDIYMFTRDVFPVICILLRLIMRSGFKKNISESVQNVPGPILESKLSSDISSVSQPLMFI